MNTTNHTSSSGEDTNLLNHIRRDIRIELARAEAELNVEGVRAFRRVLAAIDSKIDAALAAEKVAAEAEWIATLRRELMLSKMTHNFTFSRDEVIALLAAPQPAQTQVALTRDAVQQKAIDHGFKYWRAPDAHGVTGTNAQAVELLQDLLGVEVEIAAQPVSGADHD